ncbi:MAG: hypothetical protein ACI8QD_000176 [Cyclobacteriaceae bacterium]|jgi:hypothetical protein
MRTLLSYFTIAAMLFSCGEAGVGFNLSKNLPVTIPVSFPAAGFDIANFNPPASPPISEEYDLSDLGEDINDIPEVLINELAFEISGISAAEEVDLDNLTIDLILSNNSRISLVPTLSRLENQALTVILSSPNPQLEQLASTLITDKRIAFEVIFDFAEIPTVDLEFEYNLYFDVTAKIDLDF